MVGARTPRPSYHQSAINKHIKQQQQIKASCFDLITPKRMSAFGVFATGVVCMQINYYVSKFSPILEREIFNNFIIIFVPFVGTGCSSCPYRP